MNKQVFETVIHGEEIRLEAIGEQVVVEPALVAPTKIGSGGLLLPETTRAKMKPTYGVVRCVGNAVVDIAPGDTVHWGVGAGIGVDNGRLWIVSRRFLFAVEES